MINKTFRILLCLAWGAILVGLLVRVCHGAGILGHRPDSRFTPGETCSPTDEAFDGYVYAERIAHCRRSFTPAERDHVALLYGVPRKDYGRYEFDHLIPVCAGGSSSVLNVWPQLLVEAKRKDVLEDRVCRAMRAGTMTQRQAVALLRAWRP